MRRMVSTANRKFYISLTLTSVIFPRIKGSITRRINRELDSNYILDTHYKTYYK